MFMYLKENIDIMKKEMETKRKNQMKVVELKNIISKIEEHGLLMLNSSRRLM